MSDLSPNDIVQTNYKFRVTIMERDGQRKKYDVVLHRKLRETKKWYLARYQRIQQYAKGELSFIPHIKEVQDVLIYSGWGLSNKIILEVGPLCQI